MMKITYLIPHRDVELAVYNGVVIIEVVEFSKITYHRVHGAAATLGDTVVEYARVWD